MKGVKYWRTFCAATHLNKLKRRSEDEDFGSD
jgi:hypothetical protein